MAILQTKQNLFDATLQYFGSLDNVVKLSDDNGISISGILSAGTELTVNNTNLGEEDIKKEVSDKSITFNNNYEFGLTATYTADTTVITADSTLVTADAY